MDFEIRFIARRDGEDAATATEAPTWSLVASLQGDYGVNDIVVAAGYSSGPEVMKALVDALTYAPEIPDVAPYEMGLTKLTELATTMEDVTSSIMALGGRMNDAEDRLDGTGVVPQQPARRSLLPGRDTARGPQTQTAQPAYQPPPIRQVRTMDQGDHVLAGRVHGQPFGGVSRRGRGPQE